MTGGAVIYSFGPFQLDMEQRLLLREGRPVPLAPKAIRILCILVENHGKLVERERLMQLVWPDSFVEEGNLTVNIFALRKALSEGLDAPVIENIPRRGYRFVPEVSCVAEKSEVVAPASPRPPVDFGRKRLLALLVAAVVTAAGALLIVLPRHAPQVADVTQITHFGLAEGLGTDGSRLFAGRRQGGRVSLVQFGPDGGDPAPFSVPFASAHLLDVSSARKELLVAATDAPGESPVWIVPESGAAPRRFGNVQSRSARWSPDGKRVAYDFDGSLYVAQADGGSARKIAIEGGTVDAWSPDGSRVSFTITNQATGGESLWEVHSDGSGLRAIVPERRLTNARWGEGQCCGHWTPDGRYFLFREAITGSSGIWMLPDRARFGLGRPAATKLYSASFRIPDFAISPDGRKLLLLGMNEGFELVRLDPRRRQWVPLGLGPEAGDARWSPDGNWICYVKVPESTLWKIRSGGAGRTQLTFPPAQVFGPVWSPDGRQLAFHMLAPGAPGKIAVISAEGGKAQILLPGKSTGEDSPNWSPDGKKLLFLRYWLDPTGSTTRSAMCLHDLQSGDTHELPGTENLGPPQWSPDGRFIAAQSPDFRDLMLFDFRSGHWTAISHGGFIHSPKWSRDSRYLFYQDRAAGEEQPIYQVSIPEFTVRKIAGRGEFLREDVNALSLTGLTPDDQPIAAALHSNADIYSLSLKR